MFIQCIMFSVCWDKRSKMWSVTEKHITSRGRNYLKKSHPHPPPLSASELSHGKTNTSALFPPSLPSSPPLPYSPIKKRGHSGGEAGPFDPHAVLPSVFPIQPVWTGISGVDRLSARRDKSPPANCCHIKWRGTSQIEALRLMERGREKKKDSELFLQLLVGFTPLLLLFISWWTLIIC